MADSPSDGTASYRVGMGGLVAAGWLCIIFFAAASLLALHNHQYGPIWIFGFFCACGVLLLSLAGRFTFDQQGIVHESYFGKYKILWSDVRRVETGSGTVVLKGDNSRFVIPASQWWSARQKHEAFTLLVHKIQAMDIVPFPSGTASYKWHKNVRVRT